MTEDDPDDSPEYFAAKAEWKAYWTRINEGLENGAEGDSDVAFARLVKRFGLPDALEAADRHVENLGVNFENRWRENRRAREKEERQARNPHGAGRKPKRSDVALLHAWLIVKTCMKSDGLSAVRACRKLAKPPLRRKEVGWLGLLLECDYSAPEIQSGAYYVKTPETLRDVYQEAAARYQNGPESLRRHWQSLLKGYTR